MTLSQQTGSTVPNGITACPPGAGDHPPPRAHKDCSASRSKNFRGRDMRHAVFRPPRLRASRTDLMPIGNLYPRAGPPGTVLLKLRLGLSSTTDPPHRRQRRHESTHAQPAGGVTVTKPVPANTILECKQSISSEYEGRSPPGNETCNGMVPRPVVPETPGLCRQFMHGGQSRATIQTGESLDGSAARAFTLFAKLRPAQGPSVPASAFRKTMTRLRQ